MEEKKGRRKEYFEEDKRDSGKLERREPRKTVKKVIEEAKEVLLKPMKRSNFSRDTSYRSASQTELVSHLNRADDSRGQYG